MCFLGNGVGYVRTTLHPKPDTLLQAHDDKTLQVSRTRRRQASRVPLGSPVGEERVVPREDGNVLVVAFVQRGRCQAAWGFPRRLSRFVFPGTQKIRSGCYPVPVFRPQRGHERGRPGGTTTKWRWAGCSQKQKTSLRAGAFGVFMQNCAGVS